jgi:hypothetical protein
VTSNTDPGETTKVCDVTPVWFVVIELNTLFLFKLS